MTCAPRATSWRTIEPLMPVSIARGRFVAPSPWTVDPRGRHLAGQVAARHRRLGRDALARLRLVDRGREDAAAHRPRAADVADERARVDPGDPGDAGVAEPVQPAALGVGASSALWPWRMTTPRAQTRSDSIAAAADAVVAHVRGR